MARFAVDDLWADYMEAAAPILLARYPALDRATNPILAWGDGVTAQFPNAEIGTVFENAGPANGFAVTWALIVFRELGAITPRQGLRIIAKRLADFMPIYGFKIWRDYREHLTQAEINYLVAAIRGSNLSKAKRILDAAN